MIYLDNIIFNLQKNGGISKYWYYLLKDIRNNNLNYTVLNQKKFSKNIFDKFEYKKNNKTFLLPKYIERYMPVHINSNKKFIFHSSYYRVSLNKKAINIVTVHDFIYEKYRKGISKYIHTLQKNFAINNSSVIICNSKNTKNDLLNYLPKLPKENICTIPMGADPNYFKILKKSFKFDKFKGLKNKSFFLFIGNPLISYKNFSLVDDVLLNFKDKKLVIITNKNLNDIKKIVDKDNLNKIIIFSDLTDKELNFLYNNAFCLFYFSLYEGFGMPIIESMMAGCPVVSIDNSSISELIKKYPIKIKSDTSILNNIFKTLCKLEKNDYRKMILDSGIKISENYYWSECTNKTIKIYRELL